jgi:hypothetical protein
VKKQPKPKPKPCECWCTIGTDGVIHPYWCTEDDERVNGWRKAHVRIIRVRIVPVAPKKRAKAKRGGK